MAKIVTKQKEIAKIGVFEIARNYIFGMDHKAKQVFYASDIADFQQKIASYHFLAHQLEGSPTGVFKKDQFCYIFPTIPMFGIEHRYKVHALSAAALALNEKGEVVFSYDTSPKTPIWLPVKWIVEIGQQAHPRR